MEAVAQTGPRTGVSICRGTTLVAPTPQTRHFVGLPQLNDSKSAVFVPHCARNVFPPISATASMRGGTPGVRRGMDSALVHSAAARIALAPGQGAGSVYRALVGRRAHRSRREQSRCGI